MEPWRPGLGTVYSATAPGAGFGKPNMAHRVIRPAPTLDAPAPDSHAADPRMAWVFHSGELLDSEAQGAVRSLIPPTATHTENCTTGECGDDHDLGEQASRVNTCCLARGREQQRVLAGNDV